MVILKELEAAKSGDLETLQSLATIDNVSDKHGATCLHYAARGGSVRTLEFLLFRRGFSALKRSNIGATASHDAAASGNLEALRYLLGNTGSKVDDQDGTGATVLHLAARYGHTQIVRWLLDDTNCDIMKKTASGALPLHFAVFGGNFQCVKHLVDEAPRAVNMQMNNGVTAPYLACQQGHLAILKFLVLQAGASLKIHAYDGMTCLHTASQQGHLNCIKWLIENQNVNANERDFDGTTALHFAASHGHAHIVDWLMKCGGARITLDNLGGSPLHNAVELGRTECVRILLENGCQTEITDNSGLTAEELAEQCNQEACAAIIRKDPPQQSPESTEVVVVVTPSVSGTTSSGTAALASARFRQCQPDPPLSSFGKAPAQASKTPPKTICVETSEETGECEKRRHSLQRQRKVHRPFPEAELPSPPPPPPPPPPPLPPPALPPPSLALFDFPPPPPVSFPSPPPPHRGVGSNRSSNASTLSSLSAADLSGSHTEEQDFQLGHPGVGFYGGGLAGLTGVSQVRAHFEKTGAPFGRLDAGAKRGRMESNVNSEMSGGAGRVNGQKTVIQIGSDSVKIVEGGSGSDLPSPPDSLPPPPPTPPSSSQMNGSPDLPPPPAPPLPPPPAAENKAPSQTSVEMRPPRATTVAGGAGNGAAPSLMQGLPSARQSVPNGELIAELRAAAGGSSLRKTRKSTGGVNCVFAFGDQSDPTPADSSSGKKIDAGLTGDFDPKNFLEQVGSHDSKGLEIPAWRRHVLAKQMAEKAKKEAEERQKVEQYEARFKNMPAWKRALIEKKEAEAKVAPNSAPSNGSAKSQSPRSSPWQAQS